ncbi:NADH-quinone oxidoreductase subunit C [Streptomyces sp. NPDC004726]
MTAYDRLPDSVTEIFGPDATAELAYDLLTVDVPADSWIASLETARSGLGCTYFDWLSAVDEPGTGFRVCAHVVSLPSGGEGRVRRLLLRTTVPHDAPVLPSAVTVYAGADWHERETHEMFGVTFTGHPHLVPLLLPESFEGHPLRKDFVLAARVAKAWPGAKEPGESEHGGPKRRQMLPPGVPDPNEWGPLKGQLPPAPARPARTPRAAGAAGATAERPARRTRSAAGGSASQQTGGATPPRRTRSAAQGSASQQPVPPGAPSAPSAGEGSAAPDDTAGTARTGGPRRSRGEGEDSAGQGAGTAPPRGSRREGSESESESGSGGSGSGSGSASRRPASPLSDTEAEPPETAPDTPAAPARTRSADAPWHHARPAFDDRTDATGTTGATGAAADSDRTTEDSDRTTDSGEPKGTSEVSGEPATGPAPASDVGQAAESESPSGPAPAQEPAQEPAPAAGPEPGTPSTHRPDRTRSTEGPGPDDTDDTNDTDGTNGTTDDTKGGDPA